MMDRAAAAPARTGQTFTILGAAGFVGRALANRLRAEGHCVHPVTRGALPALLATNRNAGHVIDCIGLTGDFRSRPYDTAEAHIAVTAQCLAALRCDSFLFVSSTRVYARAAATHEATPLPCDPTDPSDLYNLTKLTGEALCLGDKRPTVRVVRLSNVYGPGMSNDTFLGQVLREGTTTGAVAFHQAATSAKDYIGLNDVTRLLPAIACTARLRLYNLAAGRNTSHGAIAAALSASTGWRTSFAPDAPALHFPPIETTRLRAEFAPALSDLSADLATLAAAGQEVRCSPSTRPAAA
jgi:nucleoside-diphosphate-sugar epimerase